MLEIMHQITHIPTLRAAYQRVLENGGCAGADGVSLKRFAFALQANLQDLSKSLAEQTYHPYPLLRFPVPKRQSTATVDRQLSNPSTVRVPKQKLLLY